MCICGIIILTGASNNHNDSFPFFLSFSSFCAPHRFRRARSALSLGGRGLTRRWLLTGCGSLSSVGTLAPVVEGGEERRGSSCQSWLCAWYHLKRGGGGGVRVEPQRERGCGQGHAYLLVQPRVPRELTHQRPLGAGDRGFGRNQGDPIPRDVVEGGEGVGRGDLKGTGGGGGWLGPPPPRVPLRSPLKAAEIFTLKSSWHRRRRSKILAVSVKHRKGRRGGGRGGGGGGGLLLRCTAVLIHHCPSPSPEARARYVAGGGGGTLL